MGSVKEGFREIWKGGGAAKATEFSVPYLPDEVYYASARPGSCGLLPVVCVTDTGGLEVCANVLGLLRDVST